MKTILGILGLILFITSVVLSINLVHGEKLASKLNDEKNSYGMIEGALPCTWEVPVPERVMSENKTQAIVISVKNSLDVPCESLISLRAPNFTIAPAKEEQKITLLASASGSLSWILSPHKTGTFEIAVSDALNSKIFGITVTNTLGLTAAQAKIFSILGTLFGPMFTVPWWWEKLKQRKQNQVNNKADNKPNV